MTSQAEANTPPVFIQFYDWFWDKSWKEELFLDPFDWDAIGTSFVEKGSIPFYQKQFEYIKQIGINSIAWQYNARHGGTHTLPSKNAISALKRCNLRIAPTYDMEISHKVYSGERNIVATISPNKYIIANRDTVDMICKDIQVFFNNIPDDLIARDKKGNVVIFVFGFGFNDENPDPNKWSLFAESIDQYLSPIIGEKYKFYWSSVNSHFAEHLFLYHREHFCPWHFVVDMPQSQFGHEAVTWNFGFDNLAVLKRDGLGRVIKMDPRYIEESAWLAATSNPSLIYLYGWNEPFEASFLFPSKKWGETKAMLAKFYLDNLQQNTVEKLPATLLIIDDLDEQWGKRKGDWHLSVLRSMLLYRLRLFAPQADVLTVDEVTDEVLDRYSHIIDISSKKTENLVSIIKKNWDKHRLMLFDPRTTMDEFGYAKYFFTEVRKMTLNKNISIQPSEQTVFARDDIHDGEIARISKVESWGTTRWGKKLPLVISNKNAVFVNSYGNSDEIMRVAFATFYARPIGTSILYGDGASSQRLEQSPDGVIQKNILARSSVIQRWPMPGYIDWYKQPDEVPEELFRFIFGLDD